MSLGSSKIHCNCTPERASPARLREGIPQEHLSMGHQGSPDYHGRGGEQPSARLRAGVERQLAEGLRTGRVPPMLPIQRPAVRGRLQTTPPVPMRRIRSDGIGPRKHLAIGQGGISSPGKDPRTLATGRSRAKLAQGGDCFETFEITQTKKIQKRGGISPGVCPFSNSEKGFSPELSHPVPQVGADETQV